MTTPRAHPEAVAVTEERVEAAARAIFDHNQRDMSQEWREMFWNHAKDAAHCGDCPHVDKPIPMTCERCCVEEPRQQARAALEAAAQVRAAQDHGGEANEMVGEPRSGRMAWHLKQAEARLKALEEALRPFAKAGELFRPRDPDDYDQVVYKPAAGPAYEIYGDQLRAAAALLSDHPAPESGVEAKRWRHLKRGTTYEEVGRALLQASTGPIGEAAMLVIYRDGKTGWLWAREESEFEDGRFSAIPADGGRYGK